MYYTLDDKVRIVKACLKSGLNIKEFARKNHINYSVLYSWIQKYKAKGREGLKDHRGRPRENNFSNDEIQKLREQVRDLERQLKESHEAYDKLLAQFKDAQ